MTDPGVDLGVPGSRELIDLVDVFFDGDTPAQESARIEVKEALDEESFFDSATVFGNFEMMNRVAEGVGLPVPPQMVEREAEMMRALGLYDLIKAHLL